MKTEFGLDIRKSNVGRFGRGTYFASTSQYSDHVNTFLLVLFFCTKLYIDVVAFFYWLAFFLLTLPFFFFWLQAYAYAVGNTRQLILCRVLVGLVKDYGVGGDQTLVWPPNMPSSDIPYDSVSGQYGGGGIMYVVYDNAQFYPEYIVTYHK